MKGTAESRGKRKDLAIRILLKRVKINSTLFDIWVSGDSVYGVVQKDSKALVPRATILRSSSIRISPENCRSSA